MTHHSVCLITTTLLSPLPTAYNSLLPSALTSPQVEGRCNHHLSPSLPRQILIQGYREPGTDWSTEPLGCHISLCHHIMEQSGLQFSISYHKHSLLSVKLSVKTACVSRLYYPESHNRTGSTWRCCHTTNYIYELYHYQQTEKQRHDNPLVNTDWTDLINSIHWPFLT